MSSVQSAQLSGAEAPGAEIVSRHAWKEIFGITFAVPLGIYCVHSQDPFLVRAGFPWLALLPLLLGAQHGAAAGGSSSVLLFAAAWLSGIYGSILQPGPLAAWGAGALAAGVISGHFRDRAAARLGQLSRQAAEDAKRLARLSRAHAVIRLSHQKLEEKLSAQSWSLDAAVEEARQKFASRDNPADCGRALLDLLLNHAMVQSASLFLVAPALGKAERRFELVAQSGSARSADVRHPLAERALSSGRLVAVDMSQEESGEPSVLAAVPLVTADRRELGVLLVHEMPFMAFQAANLKNVAALVAHLSDLLAERAAPSADHRIEDPARGGAAAAGVPRPRAKAEASAPNDDFTRTGTRARPSVARSA